MEQTALLKQAGSTDTGFEVVCKRDHKCKPHGKEITRPVGNRDAPTITYCLYTREIKWQLVFESHKYMFTSCSLFSFRILSLVLAMAESASLLTSSACIPSVFNNPVLFSQMQAAP